MNENFIIFFQTSFTIIYMQIKRNQRRIDFNILGADFCKNLHLAVSLRIIQI